MTPPWRARSDIGAIHLVGFDRRLRPGLDFRLSDLLLMEASTLSRNLQAPARQRLCALAGRLRPPRGADELSDSGHKALAVAIPAWQEMQRSLTQRARQRQGQRPVGKPGSRSADVGE